MNRTQLSLKERTTKVEVKIEEISRKIDVLEKTVTDLKGNLVNQGVQIGRLLEYFEALQASRSEHEALKRNVMTGALVAAVTAIVQLLFRVLFPA